MRAEADRNSWMTHSQLERPLTGLVGVTLAVFVGVGLCLGRFLVQELLDDAAGVFGRLLGIIGEAGVRQERARCVRA